MGLPKVSRGALSAFLQSVKIKLQFSGPSCREIWQWAERNLASRSHVPVLSNPCRDRPRSGRAAEQRDELAPAYVGHGPPAGWGPPCTYGSLVLSSLAESSLQVLGPD